MAASPTATTTVSEPGGQDLSRFCADAIGLNRTFSGLQGLLFRTKLLALNAEIASAHVGETGASFGVVVKELISMGTQLREVVADLEEVFREVAHHIGVWIRSRNRFEMYLRVVDALQSARTAEDEAAACPAAAGQSLIDADLGAYRCAHRIDDEPTSIARTWELALARRREAIESLEKVYRCSRGLLSLLQRLNLVATRQSGYLSTTARVEATHADQTAFNLDAVAQDIGQLATDFAALQHEAQDAATELTAEAKRITARIETDA